MAYMWRQRFNFKHDNHSQIEVVCSNQWIELFEQWNSSEATLSVLGEKRQTNWSFITYIRINAIDKSNLTR